MFTKTPDTPKMPSWPVDNGYRLPRVIRDGVVTCDSIVTYDSLVTCDIPEHSATLSLSLMIGQP